MAIITISNTGGNWNNTATWVGGVIPGAADDVVATATSGPLTVNVASSCKSIVFTNYVSTFTVSALLDVFGTFTLVPAMTIAGTNQVRFNTTATLTSAGKTIPWALLFSGTSQTYTLGDNWTVTGNIACTATTALTINTNQITANGNFNVGVAGCSGTTSIVMGGTSAISTTGQLRNNLTINTAGTVTFSGTVFYNTGTLTYTTGAVVTTGSTLSIAASTTLNTNGITWNNVTFAGSSITITLSSNLTVAGLLTLSTGSAITINGSTIFASGGITSIVASNITGTTIIQLTGGTWNGAANVNFFLNIFINGNVTITGTISFYTATLTYTSGIVITTGSTLSIAGSPSSLNTNGIVWNNITFVANSVTLLSDLTCTGLISCNGVTVNGSFNINTSGGISLSNVLNKGTGNPVLNILGGTWQATGVNGFVYLNTNLNGNVTVSGTVYYLTGILAYVSGNIVTTGSTLRLVGGSASLNTAGMTWTNIIFGGSPYTCTLLSNLQLSGTLTMGGLVTTSGAFNIYCENFTMNNSVSGGTNVFITLSTDIYVNNTLTVGPGPGGLLSMSGAKTIYVYGDVNMSIQASSAFAGDCPIRLSGTGTFTSIAGFWRLVPIIFDTPGKITLSGSFLWNGGGSGLSAQRITYIKGTIIGKNALLVLGTNSGGPTYTNMNCIPWANVNLTSGVTYTMNEFFSGTGSYKTQVVASSTTNYIIAFTDTFEKIAKFVEISNCTISRPNQLLVLTNCKAKGTNSGIRYFNQSPNGVAKNKPSVMDPMSYPAGGLVTDPNMVV